VTATAYSKRNETSPSYNSGNPSTGIVSRRHNSHETSASLENQAVPTPSDSDLPDAGSNAIKSKITQNVDFLVLSVAILSLFLIMLFLLVIFVVWRSNKRREGQQNHWTAVRTLLTVGENGESVLPVSVCSPTKHSGGDDTPSERILSLSNSKTKVCH